MTIKIPTIDCLVGCVMFKSVSCSNIKLGTVNMKCYTLYHYSSFFFFIRTSNFEAEAERSYYCWKFEPEKFLRCS